MDDDSLRQSDARTEDRNDNWDRTISSDEAQRTAAQADPDDFGTTSATDSGLTAGGEGTAIGEDDGGAGGSPYTHGYVTGGSHHPTIADLPSNEADK